MTPNTNPSAQPVDDGEAELMALGRKYKIVSIVNDPNITNDAMVEKFKQGVLSLLSQARQQSYQSGYAAAVGDAVEAAPSMWLADPKYRNLAADKDHSTAYFKALGHDEALDHYRTAIEKLGEKR